MYMERKDYQTIFRAIAISGKTIIIEIIGLIFGIAGLVAVHNGKLSMILLITSLILFTTEYISRKMWVQKELEKTFPNPDHPMTIRTIYEFTDSGVNVNIENHENSQKFTIKYNEIKRKRYDEGFAIFTTKDKTRYLIFEEDGTQDQFFQQRFRRKK